MKQNSGHGIKRKTGLDNCLNDIIALMDVADISVNNRFEQELEALLFSGADIVGGDIAEFIGRTENVIGYRRVHCVDSEIKKYMKKRCPFNQMVVMFRKHHI